MYQRACCGLRLARCTSGFAWVCGFSAEECRRAYRLCRATGRLQSSECVSLTPGVGDYLRLFLCAQLVESHALHVRPVQRHGGARRAFQCVSVTMFGARVLADSTEAVHHQTSFTAYAFLI